MANIVQGDRGEFGIEGSDQALPVGFVTASFAWDSQTGLDNAFFVAPRDYVVKGVSVRRSVSSADTSAQIYIRKAASGSALDSTATTLHSNTILTYGTANTNATVTMITAKSTMSVPAGTAIGLDYSGTTGASRGVVTVVLAPA